MNSGAPIALIRRYSDRAVLDLPLAAHEAHHGGREELEQHEQDRPRSPSASHSACDPSLAASSLRPAPCSRATCAVVP